MDLPNLLSKIKHPPELPQRFAAIEISPHAVKSAIWQVLGDTTELVSIGSLQPWETDNSDELVVAADASLNDALSGLESEPDRVIFGLPETWVSVNGIAAAKKPLVKVICERLSLKPVGFVVTLEALVRHLAEAAGGPPSVILLHLTADAVTVSLVVLGKIQGSQVVRRSDSITADVEEGLARFPKMDNFPSRMLLYDSREDLEALKQTLIAHEWPARLPFLHFPKIEALNADATIKAVALSGGAEVARSLGLDTAPTEETQTEIQPEPVSQPKPAPAKPFGFSAIPVTAPKSPPESEPEPEPEPEAEPEAEPEPEAFAADAQVLVRPVGPTPGQRLRRLPSLFLSPLRAFGRLRLPAHRGSSRKRLITFILFSLVLAGLALAYYIYPKATLTLYLTPLPAEHELEFILDPQAAAADPATRTIPAVPDKLTIKNSQSAPTTGTLTVGDKAAGTVIIYNRTLSAKTLPKGTLIKAENLNFSLNEEIKIASASSQEKADFSITLEPAKAEAKVTAEKIGSDSNLGANTKFSVANFGQDSLVATSNSAFSGGSSEQVAAVSQTDMDNLQTKLKTELQAELQKDLGLKDTPDNRAIPVGDPEVTEAEFSAKVGDTADKLSLTLGLDQPIYTFKLDDILAIAAQNPIQPPPQTTLLPSLTQVSVTNTQVTEAGVATVKAKVIYHYLPNADIQAVKSHLLGRPPAATMDYLHSLPQFDRAESSIRPKLPLGLSSYPLIPQNIAVTIAPQPEP